MQKLPLARNKDIVVQSVGKEILIYNLINHRAYNLNETSAIIFNACDGQTSFEELKRKHKLTDDLIWLALDGLKKEDLLQEAVEYISPLAGIDRRQLIRRVGLASLLALPVISSLTAPTAAMAQSVCSGALAPNTLRGICVAGIGQPPATLAGCTGTCQNVFSSACTTCTTFATPSPGIPGAFECRCM